MQPSCKYDFRIVRIYLTTRYLYSDDAKVYTLYSTAFTLLIICGIAVFEYRSKVLDFIGKISYELYIVQSLPVFVISGCGLSPYLTAALCICIDVVLAYLLHVVVLKISKVGPAN